MDANFPHEAANDIIRGSGHKSQLTRLSLDIRKNITRTSQHWTRYPERPWGFYNSPLNPVRAGEVWTGMLSRHPVLLAGGDHHHHLLGQPEARYHGRTAWLVVEMVAVGLWWPFRSGGVLKATGWFRGLSVWEGRTQLFAEFVFSQDPSFQSHFSVFK